MADFTLPTSGFDSIARYVLGLGQPTVTDLTLVHTFLGMTFGPTEAEDFREAVQDIWPDLVVNVQSSLSSNTATAYRLTDRGAREAFALLANPQDSWRRALARTVIITLFLAHAMPRSHVPHANKVISNLDSSFAATVQASSGWVDRETLQFLVNATLQAVEAGDSIGYVYKGIRDGVAETAVGRVLWRLVQDGTIRERTSTPAASSIPVQIPTDIRMRVRRAKVADLSPLGKKLLAMRRRQPSERMYETTETIRDIARQVIAIPNPSVSALSVEHVVQINDDPEDPTTRRIDLAIWSPACPPERPSLWVEFISPHYRSGARAQRLRHHLTSAVDASLTWRQHITCYVVLATNSLSTMAMCQRACMEAQQHIIPNASVTIHIVDTKDATSGSILRAQPSATYVVKGR